LKVSDQAKTQQEDKQSNTTDQGLDPSMVPLFVVYLFSCIPLCLTLAPYLTYSILFEHALTLTLTQPKPLVAATTSGGLDTRDSSSSVPSVNPTNVPELPPPDVPNSPPAENLVIYFVLLFVLWSFCFLAGLGFLFFGPWSWSWSQSKHVCSHLQNIQTNTHENAEDPEENGNHD
jgi:hypothetical protein